MPRFAPHYGLNLRLPAYQVGREQAILLQNLDQAHDESFHQIDGCTRYHGTSLGTTPPTGIFVWYNNDLGQAHVLVARGDTIYRRNAGTNEMTAIRTGLTPNQIRFGVNVNNHLFLASAVDGLFDYDGFTIDHVPGSPAMRDIIFAKEINRGFAISALIPNAILWTDDVATTGGVPILWNALNTDTVPPTEGDVLEKLSFLSGRLVAHMTNATWIEYVNGPPQNWRWEKSPTTVGWIAPKTIHQVGGELWGLGYSPTTGRGLYGFNGETARLLSYDVEPWMRRINDDHIADACAEYVDNRYKLSCAIDQATENNETMHVDTIIQQPDTELPVWYGPHTYGFHSSAVLNTRRFRGEHLIGKTYASGSWVFKVERVMTRYGHPMQDDGELIPVIYVSGVVLSEDIDGASYDETWVKRYRKFYLTYPPAGTWSATVDIYRDGFNEVYQTYTAALAGSSSAIDALLLGTTQVDRGQYAVAQTTRHIRATGIQVKLSNLQTRTRTGFTALLYDVQPIRRLQEAQRVTLPM